MRRRGGSCSAVAGKVLPKCARTGVPSFPKFGIRVAWRRRRCNGRICVVTAKPGTELLFDSKHYITYNILIPHEVLTSFGVPLTIAT